MDVSHRGLWKRLSVFFFYFFLGIHLFFTVLQMFESFRFFMTLKWQIVTKLSASEESCVQSA